MNPQLLHRFKSHIEGKNADVAIYVDRIEWAKGSRLGKGGKIALGALTAGTSLLATGVSGRTVGTEMIPTRAITSVVSEKDGIRFSKVKIISSGNTIDFRVGHDEAKSIRDLVARLIVGTHPAQQTATAPTTSTTTPGHSDSPAHSGPASAGVTGVAQELKSLAELRDAGVLSDEEFKEQKSKLLSSLYGPYGSRPNKAGFLGASTDTKPE